MDRETKLTKHLPNRKKVVINTRPTTISMKVDFKGKGNQCNVMSGTLPIRRKEGCHNYNKEKSVSDMITELILNDHEEENCFDLMSPDDIRKKPDLWMAAFDNPMDFIEYCRKRLDRERELLERSKRVEDELLQSVREWTKNTDKHAALLDDLYKVQNINDKLQQVIMEERTHCQHLVGLNDQLASQKVALARKYEAALLLGKIDEKSVHHLLEKNPKAVQLADKMCDLRDQLQKCEGKTNLHQVSSDPVVLAERVRSLEDYVDALMRQHREEVSVLRETTSLTELKSDSMKAQYTDLLKRNTKSLNDMREVVGATLRENLGLRDELVRRDNLFLDGTEEDVHSRLRRCLSCHHQPNGRYSQSDQSELLPYCAESIASQQDLQLRLTRSETNLTKKSHLLRETANQVVTLERQCSRLEEENHSLRKSHEHTVKVLKERNAMLEKRCERTESRRKLENEGTRRQAAETKKIVTLLERNIKSTAKKLANGKDQKYQKLPSKNCRDQRENSVTPNVLPETNPDLIMRAMMAWCEFLSQKVSSLPEVKDSCQEVVRQQSWIKQMSEDDDGEVVIRYFQERTTATPEDAMRVLHQRTLRDTASSETVMDVQSVHTLPPAWSDIYERNPSNYAFHLSNQDDDQEDSDDAPPPLT